MRLTESKLRQLIRQELLAANEAKTWAAAFGMATDCSVDGCDEYAMEDYDKCEKHWKEDVAERNAYRNRPNRPVHPRVMRTGAVKK